MEVNTTHRWHQLGGRSKGIRTIHFIPACIYSTASPLSSSFTQPATIQYHKAPCSPRAHIIHRYLQYTNAKTNLIRIPLPFSLSPLYHSRVRTTILQNSINKRFDLAAGELPFSLFTLLGSYLASPTQLSRDSRCSTGAYPLFLFAFLLLSTHDIAVP